MLRKIKMRFLAIGLAAMLVSLLTQPALAYYTTLGTATNVVTSGDIRLMIHESTDQGTPYPTDGVYVMPGDIISKIVTVENACSHPFYLRVKAVHSANAADVSPEDCMKLNINTADWTYHDGWYYYNEILEPGQFTTRFFSQVEIVGSQITTDNIGQLLQLTVIAQAVQSENNPIQNGDTTTAVGWPAE